MKQILMQINNRWIFCLSVLALLIAARYFTASPSPPSGFCPAQNRIVSNEEIIKQALKDPWYIKLAKFDGRHFSLINCCVVIRQAGEFYRKNDRLSEREKLYEIAWVYFNYERSQKGAEEDFRVTGTSKEDKYKLAMMSFDSCGTSVTLGDGMPLTLGPPFEGLSSKPKVKEDGLKHFVRWMSDGNQVFE